MTAPAIRTGAAAAPSMPLAERVAHEQRGLRVRATASLVLIALAVLFVGVVLTALLLDDGRWMSLPRLAPLIGWTIAIAVAATLVVALRRRYDTVLPTKSLASGVSGRLANTTVPLPTVDKVSAADSSG